MSVLKEYKKGEGPSLDLSGLDSSKMYYVEDSALFYTHRAADIFYLGTFRSVLSNYIDDKYMSTDFKRIISETDDACGEKFMAVDGKKLEIVDSEAYLVLINNIYNELNKFITDINAFLDDAVNKIKEINSWLLALQTNYDNFLSADAAYNQANKKYFGMIQAKNAGLSDWWGVPITDYNIEQARQEMVRALENRQKYEKLPNDIFYYGSWVEGPAASPGDSFVPGGTSGWNNRQFSMSGDNGVRKPGHLGGSTHKSGQFIPMEK